MNTDRKSTTPVRAVGAALALPQLALIAATLLWGGNFVVGKSLAADVPPVAISFWRWSLALLVLLPLSFGELRRHRALLLAHWRLILAIGATGIAGYTICFYQALTATSAINALLFVSTAPLLITLANWCVYRDRITPWQVLGTIVSSLGAVVVIAHGDAARLLALRFNRGDLWILAGVLIWVAYAILLRQRPAALPPQPFFASSVLAGVALLAPLYCWQFARGERLVLTGPAAAGVLYVALGVSALGYACWTRGVAALGPDRAATFMHLIPVFGTTMAVIFLGERLAPYHLGGAVLVAGGLGLASLRHAPAVPIAARLRPVTPPPTEARPSSPAASHGTLLTSDGQHLHMRRVTRDDAAALADLLLRLSRETRRLRYLSPRHFSLDDAWREAERICRGHQGTQLALVAVAPRPSGDEVLAVVELVPDAHEPATGHLAAVVRDDYQARGIGSALMRHLLELARGSTLTTLRANLLAENHASWRLLNKLGLSYTARTVRGETEVRAWLATQS